VLTGYMVQLVGMCHQCWKAGFDSWLGQTEHRKNDTCSLCLALMGHGWVQRNSSSVMLPLTCNQCSIHCENSCVAHSASKQKWALQTTCDTPKGVQKPSI